MEQQSNKGPRRVVFKTWQPFSLPYDIWRVRLFFISVMQTSSRSSTSPCAFQHRYLYLSLYQTSGNFGTQTKRRHFLLDQWCKLCGTRECFCFSYRYGPRQAYQITIPHQNSWTEITISGGLDQNVPQSFASQMDRWGRHLLAVVHEIKQLNLTYRRVNTELLIHHTRKLSKVLTAFSKKKKKTTFKYYTGDLCQKYQIRLKRWQKRHYFACIFFYQPQLLF